MDRRRGISRQHGDLIGLLVFLQNKEIRLKISIIFSCKNLKAIIPLVDLSANGRIILNGF
jgi:hypothetical protein